MLSFLIISHFTTQRYYFYSVMSSNISSNFFIDSFTTCKMTLGSDSFDISIPLIIKYDAASRIHSINFEVSQTTCGTFLWNGTSSPFITYFSKSAPKSSRYRSFPYRLLLYNGLTLIHFHVLIYSLL